MDTTIQWVTTLERINYEATLPMAQATPGLDLHLRDDVIITSSDIFPFPDTTHACWLRATPQTVDNLINEVINYFKGKGLPPTIFISPACTPADLTERLLQQGFTRQEGEEAWLTLNDLPHLEIPAAASTIAVRCIDPTEALTFSNIFMTAFDLPLEFAPAMAQLLTPSLNLPGVYHYLALCEEQPVGICSLICYQKVGILGSAGVIPQQRGSKAIFNLIVQAMRQAQQQGVETLLLQTAAGTPLERLLRISGFKRAFTRIGYTLS
jgi:hypothetical protein